VTVYIIYVFIGISLYHLRFGVVSVYIIYLVSVCIVFIWIGGILYNLLFVLVSVYIIYAWGDVSLFHLRLDWCQFILSTLTLVSVCIIYVLIGVS